MLTFGFAMGGPLVKSTREGTNVFFHLAQIYKRKKKSENSRKEQKTTKSNGGLVLKLRNWDAKVAPRPISVAVKCLPLESRRR
jgi:hypothetical protein